MTVGNRGTRERGLSSCHRVLVWMCVLIAVNQLGFGSVVPVAPLFAVVPSFAWFLVASGVWGLALGIASDAPGAYAADSAPPGMNAAVMSTYRMLSDAGYVLGPMLLGIVASSAGAPSALAVAGGLLVVSATLFGRFAPETYRRR